MHVIQLFAYFPFSLYSSPVHSTAELTEQYGYATCAEDLLLIFGYFRRFYIL